MASDIPRTPPFRVDVVNRFGFMPNFFCTASAAPGLMEELWGFARAAYIDNPLPSIFKERLLVHLSRFCRIRYCVTRHVGFLIGEGRPAGDPSVPVQSVEQALALLRRPPLSQLDLDGVVARWESRERLAEIPSPETKEEFELLDILTSIFLDPPRSGRACRALKNALGECTFELLVAFLAFTRTLHIWTETHPELEIEDDMVACMAANPELARLLKSTREAEEFGVEGLRVRLAATETALQEAARMEMALRKSEAALKQADQRKDEFIATLAHELRNPLAPILSATYILQDRYGAGHQDGRLLETVQRQTEHLIRLVDDLLEISRITRGTIELRKEKVNVVTVVRDALESCEPLIEKKSHRVVRNVPEAALWLDGDPVRLTQVIVNLLDNAAKYTPPRGVIEIEAARDGDDVVCRVRDDGIGIASDVLPRVFDLFSRNDTERMVEGGLGIGLALVRRLAEMHGGRVEAHSGGLGHGSEFVVRFPASDGPIMEEPVVELPHGGVKATRVLVIEDHPDVGEMFQMMLENLGAVVELANSGPSGLEIVDRFEPELIFVDIGMPGMDGYETARRLRERGRRFTLVALTGWGLDEDRRRALESGFDLHLTKPARIDAVKKLLDTVALQSPAR